MTEKHITNSRDRKTRKYRAIHLDLARDVALAKVKTKRESHIQHRKNWLAGLN